MKILIVGSGAVGGYFGGRLLQAGRDVTFFVRAGRAADLAKRGLRIRSPHGDIHLPSPPTITSDGLHQSSFDLAILSCKAQDLDSVIDAFAPAVGDKTVILPLLNGMRHLDVLGQRFGSDHVLGGVCMISATRDVDGTIVHLTPLQEIRFGERGPSNSHRIRDIESTLANAGFRVQVFDNIVQAMWEKWVFIATLAGITCLMRASIGDIEAAGAGDATCGLLQEVTAISKLEGCPVRPESFQQYLEMLTQPRSPLQASMLRDIESGASTEGDHILGDLVVRAERHNLPTPILRIAHFHLKCYETRRARQQGRQAQSS